MISCILLAAGYSSRFGSPKALAKLSSKTVIEQLQENLIASFVDEVIIVLGANNTNINPFILKHKKVKAVYNKDHNFGQTSSVKAGLKGVSDAADGIIILPVDYPLITVNVLNLLIEKFVEVKPLVLLPVYKDRKGHPPVFSSELKNEILGLENDVGLNTISRQHSDDVCLMNVNDSCVVSSFNTSAEFEELKKVYLKATTFAVKFART